MGRRRRGRDEGTIRQRPDGSWEARVSLGYDASGRRNQRSLYGKTKAEVSEKMRQLQSEAARGQVTEPTTLTVRQFLESWLEDTAKPKTSPTTYERYEQLVRLHIVPHIGSLRLRAVQPIHINNLMGAIGRSVEAEDPNRSPLWTQKMAGTLLSNALRQAVRLRLIPSNPAADVPRARPGDKAIEILTVPQGRRFLEAARGRRLHALLVLALASGMRQGELFGLRWDAIDFDREQITVRHSLAQLKGRFVLKEPKSKRSRRTIKVPLFVIDALREHQAMMEKEGHRSPFCFVTKTGKHIGKSNLTRQVFRPTLRAAGLPQVRFHALRHSHATMLLNNGASIKAVSHRLGHSSVELTLRVYAHVLPDADDVLSDQAAKLLG